MEERREGNGGKKKENLTICAFFLTIRYFENR
jgi:hypothetical protein